MFNRAEVKPAPATGLLSKYSVLRGKKAFFFPKYHLQPKCLSLGAGSDIDLLRLGAKNPKIEEKRSHQAQNAGTGFVHHLKTALWGV